MSHDKVKIASSPDGYPYWAPFVPIVTFCLERGGKFADEHASITKPFYEDKNGANYCHLVGPTTLQDVLDNFELPDHFEVGSPYDNCISDTKHRSDISFTSFEKHEYDERNRAAKQRKVKGLTMDVEYDANTETALSADGQYKLTYTRELVGHDFSTFTWSRGEAHLQTEWVPLGGTYQRDITLKSLAFSDDGQNFDDVDALTNVLGIIARLLAVPRVSKVNVDRPDNQVRISLRTKNIQKLVPSEKIDQVTRAKVNSSHD